MANDSRVSKRLSEGEETKRCNSELSNFHYDEDYDDDDEHQILTDKYMEFLRHATPFTDGINKRLAELDVDENASIKEKIDFILCQCEKLGILNDSSATKLNAPTLKNWLTSAPPTDRKKVFLLCFALEMNLYQCKEFFFKSFLSRPFNFKDNTEAIYFHCFAYNKPYRKAVELLSRLENMPKYDAIDNIDTISVGEEIAQITDENELLEYIANNQFDKTKQHIAVRERINKLLKLDMLLATEESEHDNTEPNKPINSCGKLLNQIYNFHSDAAQLGRFSKSKLPPLIAKNMPTRQNMVKVLNGETDNDDLYRKALELLFFYQYYTSEKCNQIKCGIDLCSIDLLNQDRDKKDELHYYQFKNLLDKTLNDCGYLQLYVRHPFDWVILFCARHNNPLEAWRDIIDDYYLSMADEETY